MPATGHRVPAAALHPDPGDVEARTGRAAHALQLLDELEAENQRTRQRFNDAELARTRANALRIAVPDLDRAEAAYRSALTIAKTQKTRIFELRAALDLARLQADRGRARDAQTCLSEALVGFEPTPELPEIEAATTFLAAIE